MSIESKTIITNEFVNGMQSLVNADQQTANINLVSLANESNITSSELTDVYTQAINGLLTSKQVIINELSPADMLAHLRLKQAFKRHSSAVVQAHLLESYDRPQAANILSHIKTTNKGLVFSEKTTKAKLNNFSCFDCYAGKIVVLGTPKFNSDSNRYEINIISVDANIQEMVAGFNDWHDSLNDFIPLLSSDSTTTPTTALSLIDATVVDNTPVQSIMLQKELDNSRDIVALKEQDIKTSQSEIDRLKQRVSELEQENVIMFELLSPSKQKKLKAA